MHETASHTGNSEEEEAVHIHLSCCVSKINRTIELTSEFHGLWRDRADFLDRVVALFVAGAIAGSPQQLAVINPPAPVIQLDLPAQVVEQILQQAKKHSLQTYALIYVLFGAGLSESELILLSRSNHSSSSDRQLLQIGSARQVPVNQWIMGKRYGSYLKNPLTQWLRSRKDAHSALFINPNGTALTEADLRQLWQQSIGEIIAPTGLPTIAQAQATWCVEMIMRGLSIEAMQVLTGWETTQLEPYARRAQELTILAQAFNVDRHP